MMPRKIEPMDVMGTLHSSDGLRFSFPTASFLELTEGLEAARPGVRSEIITEAQYAEMWRQTFPEIAFLISVLLLDSALAAFAISGVAWTFEQVRCLTVGPFFPYNGTFISRHWNWLRFLAFPITAMQTWDYSTGFAIVIAIFSIRSFFSLVILIYAFAIGLPLTKLVLQYTRFEETRLTSRLTSPVEAIILCCTIEKWKTKCGL